MIGTRGVPAAYGGFETAVEEIGRRLADRGHEVVVYCRRSALIEEERYLGMRLIHLPSVRSKSLETLSHTSLSVAHAILRSRPDTAFVFNAANAPLLPFLRAFSIPTAVHVDGLEWKRDKWGPLGRKYYRAAESTAVQLANALIADARGISDYYRAEFGVSTELITYGAPIQWQPRRDRIGELGLEPGSYHLVVARFEPENHVDVIVDGYHASGATLPLTVVGSAPYSARYVDRIAEVAAKDPRIRLLGAVWDQELLDQLYANALTYLHGHSVGGTNPSLLRAMGAGTSVLAYDVVFNREVIADAGPYFTRPAEVARLVEQAEGDKRWHRARGARLRDRAASEYDWEIITDAYEDLAIRLSEGQTMGRRGRRVADSGWSEQRALLAEESDV